MKKNNLQQLSFPNAYNIENNFSLFIRQNISSARIKMMMHSDPVNTADFPHTFDLLQNLLPSVLTTECFNDQNLPFYQEVKNTEIGHLFEHILLEYMCQLKIAKGHKSAVYAGRTKWNWERDPRGLFHININCTIKDADILPLALDKTINLMKIILQKNFYHHQNHHNDILNPAKAGTEWYLGMKNGKKLK